NQSCPWILPNGTMSSDLCRPQLPVLNHFGSEPVPRDGSGWADRPDAQAAWRVVLVRPVPLLPVPECRRGAFGGQAAEQLPQAVVHHSNVRAIPAECVIARWRNVDQVSRIEFDPQGFQPGVLFDCEQRSRQNLAGLRSHEPEVVDALARKCRM